jgi:hypothetical protein
VIKEELVVVTMAVQREYDDVVVAVKLVMMRELVK